jgi:hypothetical protein
VSFAAVTLCVASQRVFIVIVVVVVVYFFVDSVWKLLDTPSYVERILCRSVMIIYLSVRILQVENHSVDCKKI